MSRKRKKRICLTLVEVLWQVKYGYQTESWGSSNYYIRTSGPGLFPPAIMEPHFANRCISTSESSVESASYHPAAASSDLAPRIKFKRLDKTARHIMQACRHLVLILLQINMNYAPQYNIL